MKKTVGMVIQSARKLDYFDELFCELRPDLEEILRRYEIPPYDARTLLEESILELIYKGGEYEDPAVWLVSRLRSRCRRYWVSHRRQVAEAVGRVFAKR